MASTTQMRITELRSLLADLPGQLVVVSGPSAGAGKGKIISELLKIDGQNLWRSVSKTTRAPRADDQPRHTYYFVTKEAFEQEEAEGLFLEANGVTEGQRYGTPLPQVIEHLRQGQVVLLEIEIEGGQLVHEIRPDTLCVFIKPTDGDLEDNLAELRRRIAGRGTNDEASIARRLAQAADELRAAEKIDYYQPIVNRTGQAEAAAQEIYELIRARATLPQVD